MFIYGLCFIFDFDGVVMYDEIIVDIVIVFCFGGYFLCIWNRDGLISRFFGVFLMCDVEVDVSDMFGFLWVR